MAKRRKHAIDSYGNTLKWIVVACIILMIGMLGWTFYMKVHKDASYDGIAYIESFMTPSGKLNDFQNKLGMKDPATDIKWYKSGNEVEIDFGKIIMKWNVAEFNTLPVRQSLERINIIIEDVSVDGEDTYKVYYAGQEIERWIK